MTRHESRRFRRPGTVWLGRVGTAGFLVALVPAMLDDGVERVNAGLDQKAVGALALATAAWLIWRVTVYPSVDVSDSHLRVRQPFFTYEADWPLVGTADALDGMRVALAGVGIIRPWAFSGSMLAELTGDGAARQAVHAVNQMRQRGSPAGSSVRQRWSLGVTWLAATWGYGVCLAALTTVRG